MKIGIVTMIGNSNYGNVLQNFAVQKIIENLGYESCTLNNNTSNAGILNNNSNNRFTFKYAKRYIRSNLQNRFGCKNDRDYYPVNLIKASKNRKTFKQLTEDRKTKLGKFRENNINYDPNPVDSVSFIDSIEEYSAFVCGSDVVWHPTYHKNKDADFLCFAPKYKRIAFAPSFGVSIITEESRKKEYCKWLNEIEYLSVRDESGYNLIKDLTGRESTVLMDPTLCIKASEWRKYAVEPKEKPYGDFCLCYFIGNMTKEYERFIKKESQGKEIVYICDVQDLKYYATSIEELLWLIDNAKMVFTDSFHGVVFSILFHTKFIAFERVEDGLELFTRIESLLKLTKLENNKFGNHIKEYNFDLADRLINERTKVMIDYLNTTVVSVQKFECEDLIDE